MNGNDIVSSQIRHGSAKLAVLMVGDHQHGGDAMPRRVWMIEGYDEERLVFERPIPAGSLTDQEVIALLQRLASRYLDEDQIVDSSLNKVTTGYAPYLEVVGSAGRFGISGNKFTYTATVRDMVMEFSR